MVQVTPSTQQLLDSISAAREEESRAASKRRQLETELLQRQETCTHPNNTRKPVVEQQMCTEGGNDYFIEHWHCPDCGLAQRKHPATLQPTCLCGTSITFTASYDKGTSHTCSCGQVMQMFVGDL